MIATIVSRVIALVVLLSLSAFFSSSETALTTVSQIRMRNLADEGNKRAKKVLTVTANPPKMLSAILIGNNIVNLSASSMATALVIAVFGNKGVAIATGILTFLILIFGEITPKTMATIRSERIALRFGPVILLIVRVLTPVIFIVNKFAVGVMRLMGVKASEGKRVMTEGELRTIVDVSHEEGVIEAEEKEMINNVFDFGDAEAEDIMVPRIDITFAQADASYDELLEIFREDHFTRIPVYEKDTDDVIGILNMKDLLLCDREHFSLREIIRDPFFTYEHKKTSELLIEMKRSSINIAIVLDEYGTTAGMITLEDLIEEIVGEIHDEYDEDEDEPMQKISDREYLVNGSLSLSDFNDALDLKLASEDYDSIGGYIIGVLDHLPALRESITTKEGVFLQVTAKDRHRIEKVYVRLPEGKTETTLA